MSDILITEETLENLKTEQAALQKRLAQIEQVLQAIPVLREIVPAPDTDADMSTPDAVLAVLKKDRGRLFAVADIMHGLIEMRYAPAENWAPERKYLYVVLGRLTKNGQIKKINGQYTLDGQQDANTGQGMLPETAAGETRPETAASASVDP